MKNNIIINPKTVSISEDNWEYLQNLRIKYKLKSVNELLSLILIHTKEAIKKGDLEVYKK